MGWADGLGDSTQSPAPAPDAGTAAPSGGSGWASGLGGGSSNGWASGLGGTAAPAPAAPAPKASGHKGFFGQLGSLVNPVNLVRGITHLAGEAAQNVGVAPNQIVNHFEQLDPFYHPSEATRQSTSSPLVNAVAGNPTNLGGAAKGEKGLHVFAQQSPTLYQAGKHLEQTVQGVPDLAVNAAEDVTGNGPGLANSIYGRRIHNEGVLGAGISTLGDAAMLAGGVGALGKAAGFGNLAKASEAEGLAARAVANVGEPGIGTIDTAEKAHAAAQAARAAGDVSKADEYDSAAANLAKAAEARGAAAARGGLGQAAESATAGAKTISHFGNQVAGAPAELYTKLIPKVADAATAGKAGELATAAGERLGNTEFMQNRAAGKTMKELMGRSASEEQRLANPVNAATAQIQRLFKGNRDAEVAAYLSRSGDAATVLSPLAKLPDAEIQATIDANPFLAQEGVTPDAVRMAAAHAEGTLPAETASKIDQAHSLMEDEIYGPKAERHTTGYGDKAPMNPIKQAGREANVAGQPSQLSVGKLEDKMRAPVQKLLYYHQAKLDEALQQGLSERNAPLSPTQERQAAVREGVTKTTKKLASERRGISATAKAEEATTRAQDIANRRSLADANREIAARSGRVNELQTRLGTVPEEAANHPDVQAPQVRSLLSHANAVRESLRARAAEIDGSDPALADQLRAAAEAQPKTVADLNGAAKYIAGGEAPEGSPRTGSSSGQRMRSRVLTGSERARQTDVAPLTAEGQQKQVLGDIAGRPRNELPRMVQHELGSTAHEVASESGLEGEALAAHLKEQGYTAWDPEGSGGVLSAHKVTADSPVLPTRIIEQYQKWNPTKDPGWLARAAGTVNKAGRTLKLLGSAFPLHKMGADTLLDAAVAGVNPFKMAENPGVNPYVEGGEAGRTPMARAISDVRNKTLPADVGIQRNYPIEPAETIPGKISNAGRRVAGGGMAPFRAIDTTNRALLYRSLEDKGYSPQTAAEVTKLAAGDLQGMSPAEKAAGRRVLTYYPWQKHLATIAKNLVTSHPAGLAEAASLAQDDAKAHPGQQAQRGELADFMNPFGSFILTPTPKAGQSMADAVAERVQQSINPLLELGGGALAGVNLHKGQPVTTPSHPFGSQGGGEGPLITHPGDLGNFALHTLVPQFGQVQDVVGGAKGTGGFIPYRQDTGQPESKPGTRGSAGGVQAEADTTRADAIARLLGYPHAEKPPVKKKSKRGRG